MEPISHPQATHRFGPPADWDEVANGPCGTLEVAKIFCDGGTSLQSMWRPEVAELDALLRGAAVILTIHGTAHPVVSLGVTEGDPAESTT